MERSKHSRLDGRDTPGGGGHRSGITASDASGVLGSDLDSTLAQWLERATVDQAATERARRHWLTIQAEGDSTLVGVLVDLGERGRPVAISVDDKILRGRIVGTGADFVVLERDDTRAAIIPLGAVGMVRSTEDLDVWGDREVRLETTLVGIGAAVAAERPEVTAWTTSGMVNGVLRSAGDDVLRIRLDNGTSVWVALTALRLLVLN